MGLVFVLGMDDFYDASVWSTTNFLITGIWGTPKVNGTPPTGVQYPFKANSRFPYTKNMPLT
ncbi:hypothetical protein DZB84_19945 [Bacillus sp. HNG]|nr:hypothetical protein DZB84_19945 [Bacillus sp. HNG]